VQTQHQLRYRKRVPVEFDDGDRHHLGIVLNVSKGGLFVSSRVTPRVGSRVVLNFSPGDRSVAAGIPARVVWKRKVHRSAHSLADGGIGLEIEGVSEAYEQFIRALVPGLAGSPEPTLEAAGDRTPDTTLSRYRVRATVEGTPRTRTLEIIAANEEQAGSRVLASLGDGWQVVEVSLDRRRS
jgi:Tfp pilus assembly protein PilZ